MSDRVPEFSGSESRANSSMARVLMEFENVSRTFDDGAVQALRDVSLTIREREYLAIMGPSGSGKSTLLNLMGGLDRPTRGEIRFRGDSLVATPHLDRFRSRHLGFVFQSFHLLPTLNAVENVQIPMFEGNLNRRERQRRAEHLLELVGMTHRTHQYPQKMSVGERQRVAIARALANEPELILADEPTGNLDQAAGTQVLDLFDRLHSEQNVTLVVITHDRSVAQRAERILWMRDGVLSNADSTDHRSSSLP